MFVRNLLLIFLVVPAALIGGTLALSASAGLWFLFLAFPVGITAFALWRHVGDSK